MVVPACHLLPDIFIVFENTQNKNILRNASAL
jgi:hypothetical protein